LATIGFPVIGGFAGYVIINSRNMTDDALTVEGAPGVTAILKQAGLFKYYEIAGSDIDKLIGSLGAPPEPLAKAVAGRAGQAGPPEPVVDGFAQLEMHRALKRRRENERRKQQRLHKAQFAQPV
jgi:hypothetical protein